MKQFGLVLVWFLDHYQVYIEPAKDSFVYAWENWICGMGKQIAILLWDLSCCGPWHASIELLNMCIQTCRSVYPLTLLYIVLDTKKIIVWHSCSSHIRVNLVNFGISTSTNLTEVECWVEQLAIKFVAWYLPRSGYITIDFFWAVNTQFVQVIITNCVFFFCQIYPVHIVEKFVIFYLELKLAYCMLFHFCETWRLVLVYLQEG
jgi:hypothetical protein